MESQNAYNTRENALFPHLVPDYVVKFTAFIPERQHRVILVRWSKAGISPKAIIPYRCSQPWG